MAFHCIHLQWISPAGPKAHYRLTLCSRSAPSKQSSRQWWRHKLFTASQQTVFTRRLKLCPLRQANKTIVDSRLRPRRAINCRCIRRQSLISSCPLQIRQKFMTIPGYFTLSASLKCTCVTADSRALVFESMTSSKKPEVSLNNWIVVGSIDMRHKRTEPRLQAKCTEIGEVWACEYATIETLQRTDRHTDRST